MKGSWIKNNLLKEAFESKFYLDPSVAKTCLKNIISEDLVKAWFKKRSGIDFVGVKVGVEPSGRPREIGAYVYTKMDEEYSYDISPDLSIEICTGNAPLWFTIYYRNPKGERYDTYVEGTGWGNMIERLINMGIVKNDEMTRAIASMDTEYHGKYYTDDNVENYIAFSKKAKKPEKPAKPQVYSNRNSEAFYNVYCVFDTMEDGDPRNPEPVGDNFVHSYMKKLYKQYLNHELPDAPEGERIRIEAWPKGDDDGFVLRSYPVNTEYGTIPKGEIDIFDPKVGIK